ncbi:hypothetical protein RJT34_24017 [Clitoria ternatea]|uniref:Transposase n=1 Tax=Clitoria ternatea TaxID=43366 RepID=A0AAN9FPX8_CLITE
MNSLDYFTGALSLLVIARPAITPVPKNQSSSPHLMLLFSSLLHRAYFLILIMPIRGRGLRTRRRGRSCNLSKLSQKHIGSAPTPASPHSSGAGSTVRLLTSIGQTVTTNGQQVTVPGLTSAQSLVQEHTFRQSIVVLEPITTQSTAVQEPVRRQSTTVQKSGRRQSAAVSQPDGVQEPPSRQPVGVQEPPSRQPATVQEPAVGQSARVQRPAGRQSAAAVRQSVGVHEPPSRQPAGVQEPSSRQLATVQEPAVRQPARVQWRAGRQSAAAVRQPASVQQPAGRQTVAFRQPTSIHPAGRESAAVQEPASSQATSVQDQSAPIPGSDYAQSSPASISANHGNGNLNLVPSTGDTNATTVKKLVISVEAVCHPRRFVPSCVTREITPEILTRMPIPAGKWKEYPVEVKDVLFNEFKEKYKFATPYDNSMARTVWNRTCADRYPDLLAKARETAFKRISSNNIANLKGHGPRGMRREVWDGLVDIWVSKEWQKKSQAGRSNRASIPDSMLHTGGSSFGEHKRKMEAELKRPVTYRDTYDRVHKRKNGEYVSERSKKVVLVNMMVYCYCEMVLNMWCVVIFHG